MIDLDANFLIAGLREDAQAVKWIRRWLTQNEVIVMSAPAWSEFLCGPLSSKEKEQAQMVVRHVEPFAAAEAALAAELFNATGRRSRSHVDCMIAAHAIRRESLFATLNLQDFRPFRKFGLKLV